MSQPTILSPLPSWGRATPRSSVAGHEAASPVSTAGLVRTSAAVFMSANTVELPCVGPPFASSWPRPTVASPVLLWSPVPAKAHVDPVSRLWPLLVIVPPQLVPLRARSVFTTDVTPLVTSLLYRPPPPPVA